MDRLRVPTLASSSVALTLVSLGVFVAALDQTVVVTALPEVMVDLKIPFTELDRASWIITAYLLGYTVAMPLMGRMADAYGHRLMYQLALLIFALGSLLVALSTSLPWMVTSRVVQAVGGGATVPIGMAIASRLLPAGRRGLALGLIGAAAEAGSAMGPLYGGTLIHVLGWRWIFWINLPLSALLIGVLALLPRQQQRGVPVDYLGGMLLAGALTALSLGLSRRGAFAFDSMVPFLLLGLGALVVVSLVVVERHTWQPLLAPFLLRSVAFMAANAAQLLVGTALIIAMVSVPLMADTVMGREPLEGGLRLMRLTGAIPVGALLGGYLVGKVGVRKVMLAALALMALAFSLMSGWTANVREPWHSLHLATGGLGFGLAIAPITVTAINAVPSAYMGTAASLVTVSRMVGMTLGLAALSAWGMGHFQVLTAGLQLPLAEAGETAQQLAQRTTEYQAQVTGAGVSLFQSFFRIGAVLALVAIIPSLMMRRSEKKFTPPGFK